MYGNPSHGDMNAEPGAIDARQLDLGRAHRWGTGRGRWHFDKAQRQRGRRWGPCGPRGHPFFEIDSAHPYLFGHARGWQGCGQGHGTIPKLVGNPFRGVYSRLAPVCTLRGQLVELVVAMQRGVIVMVASQSSG